MPKADLSRAALEEGSSFNLLTRLVQIRVVHDHQAGFYGPRLASLQKKPYALPIDCVVVSSGFSLEPIQATLVARVQVPPTDLCVGHSIP